MPRFVRCLLTIGVLAGLPATAWADWTRMRTANFLFIAETTDRQLRETARKLEQFREVMLRALPNASAVSPVPTVVILFRQDRSFSPFKPQFEGRNTDVAGYFLGHEDVNYLVVNIENGELGFSTVFHEYSHFLIGNTLGHVPVWVSEGLAQFYESFEERDSGRIAVIGMPIGDHIAVLRQSTPIPIRDLIAVDSQSPIYNEGNRRGLFYAQSWALMHYLYLGSNQERTPQLHEYLTQIRAGAAPDGAFRKAFGDTSILDKELRGYVNQVTMTFMRMTSDSKVETAIPQRGDKIDDLEADSTSATFRHASAGMRTPKPGSRECLVDGRQQRVPPRRSASSSFVPIVLMPPFRFSNGRLPKGRTMARCRARSGVRSSVGCRNWSTPARRTNRL
jgi:hypothetical protein